MSSVISTTADRSQSEPFGDSGHITWLKRFEEGERDDVASGYWFVGPDDVTPDPVIMPLTNTLLVVSGHLSYTDVNTGVEHDLPAGSSAVLQTGSTFVVKVLEPTVEFFVYTLPAKG